MATESEDVVEEKQEYLNLKDLPNRCHVNIPIRRLKTINQNMLQKLNYLANRSSVVGIIDVLPDWSDEILYLSGITFESQGSVFPIGAGWDIGCGYRLLYADSTKDELYHVVQKINEFGFMLTQPKPGVKVSIDDVALILTDPKTWLSRRGYFDSDDEQTGSPNKITEGPTMINIEDLSRTFARIPPGNHFIEIRPITKIYEKAIADKLGLKKDGLLVLIHTGAGKVMEYTTMRTYARACVSVELLNLRKNQNGYKIELNLESELAKIYILDSGRSKNFAYANRQVLTMLLRDWLKVPIRTLFDVVHDDVTLLEDGKIRYQKGVQQFVNIDEFPLAIIPGTINESNFLVLRTGDITFINHGVGEGEGGKSSNSLEVISNIKINCSRLYYDLQDVFDLYKNLRWVKPILKSEPWISIKNGGEW